MGGSRLINEISTAIVPYKSDDARACAQDWAALGDATQKRAAMEAARDHDAAALWELTQAWLIHGRKGASVSLRTLRSYREALTPRPSAADGTPPARKTKGTALLDAWAGENLLHPARRRLVVRSGKGGKKRTVPLSTSLVAELARSARAPGAGVGGAPGEGGARVLPYKDRLAVWYRLRALARRAGVTPLGVHSLRHYAGTRLTRENNGNLRPTQKMLGHESIVTSEIYAAWSDESLGEQLKTW